MSLHNVVTVGREANIQQLAHQVGQNIFAADNILEALELSRKARPDLVLFDHRFEPDHISEFINMSDKNSKTYVVVIGKDNSDSEMAAKFLRAGAHDYLQWNKEHSRLKQIANLIKNKQQGLSLKNSPKFFANDLAATAGIVGQSFSTVRTLKMTELVAASQCNPVLVTGETGTGKELVAQAIHTLRHPTGPFVAVNCAALTANLLESELFGHAKGSFTSAHNEKLGLLELAENGTIFLDEISEMPIELQAKLLRVIQEKTFRKVGGTKEITCKATIIVSSNHNLKKEAQANRFRSDLYYRLDICPITVTPLRDPERKADISLLAEYFLQTSTISEKQTDKITSITELALQALQEHDWPGNIRELRNVIERAILLETTDKIGLSSILIDSGECKQYGVGKMTDKIESFSLIKAERELIARALQETSWQKTRAAALLGITRATLYAKVKQHNIEKGIYVQKEVKSENPAASTPEYAAAI